jgi:hypothetical protein
VIPNAQFDAASLAVWTTTGNLLEPEASIAAAAMQLAASGQDPTEALNDFPRGHPLRPLLLWLISGVWHEKRHFFDTCLTNYGAPFPRPVHVVGQLGSIAGRGERKR